uniref:Uncharacterized protein n=1 Tax=Oryza sativa subsp. japonica TaxID=39947 RepID=Q69JN4_ORYSJ|nr:hypothetical protein [Oryza sativa Japonica Group]
MTFDTHVVVAATIARETLDNEVDNDHGHSCNVNGFPRKPDSNKGLPSEEEDDDEGKGDNRSDRCRCQPQQGQGAGGGCLPNHRIFTPLSLLMRLLDLHYGEVDLRLLDLYYGRVDLRLVI